MGTKFTFDELLAKREQREADKLKVGLLTLAEGGKGLEARMPPGGAVLELYGELAAAESAQAALACGRRALYTCCPQLQDRELQRQLGVQDDPMGIIDKLFTLPEQDQLGGQALRFLGLLPGQEDQGADAGIQTIKN